MKKYNFLLFIVFHSFIYSQSQTNHWNFGNKAALNFNNGGVNVMTDSEMDTPAGSASISDTQGNLLFYTNGQTVWNKNHAIMENGEGLAGEINNTQTSIIIPKPGTAEKYYIFSTRVNSTTTSPLLTKGVYLAEIEISSTYPLGKVLTRFQTLRDASTERITAVHHKDGKAIWLITFGEAGGTTNGVKNTFSSYKIDENGLNPPLYSVQEETVSASGAMKASPDGQLIAIADQGDRYVYLYNFDNETGAITANIKIFADTGLSAPKSPYGIAFSRDSKMLYYSGLVGNTGSINQYSLENLFPDDPLYSPKKELFSSSGTRFGSIQLANDSKIYVALFEQETNGISALQKLGVINFPEEIGVNSQYTHNALDLSSGASNKGLPNFIQSYFASRIVTENKCVGTSFTFTATSYANIDAIAWDFGDGNTAIGLTANHIYNSPGAFTIKATLNIGGASVILYKSITVYPLPDLLPNQELTQCDEDNDGLSNFNLFNIGEKVSANYQSETFFFYKTQNDLDLDIQISNPTDFINTIPNQKIFTKVVNENNCENSTFFFLKAQFVQLNSISPVYTCEDSDNIIGNAEGRFNLRPKETAIKVELNLPDTSLFSFFPTFQDAKLKTNAFSGIVNSRSRRIWVRVDDRLLGCNGIQSFDLVVNDAVEINLQDSYTICFDTTSNPPIIANGGSTNDRYEWLNASNIVVSTAQNFRLTMPGVYTHIAYKTQNGITCSTAKEFEVNVKESPTFREIIVDTATPNITLDIDITGNSSYLYSIDNSNFFGNGTNYQFNNVSPGIVTVYVKDIENCEPPIQKEVSIIGFPKFFTPNNDGRNERWSVKGATTTFFTKIDIVIFNRYGTVMHVINSENPDGWDGNYKGKTVPSGEYWYTANLIDFNEKTIRKTGNFSLLRR
ncbi:T9SS type B sorting domain-containing protein [Polaribacter sp.]|nr:T9SS type B sorting domain-containing protein [Polaribacter sp.]